MSESFFEHAVYNQYGAVISGGTASEREEEVVNALTGDTLVVDCRDITDKEDFITTVIHDSGYMTADEIDDLFNPGSIEMRRALRYADGNLVVAEFDSMDADTQRGVAQLLKGIIEHSEWDDGIVFTAEKAGVVTQAERDLSGRVKNYELS